jgi:hypothetical protein
LLATILWVGGLTLALWVPAPFATGAWLTGVTLAAFGVAGRQLVVAEEAAP